MKVFSKRIEVPDYLCDRDDRLHTWAAIRLCQEVSELHSKATAIGYEDMRRKNMIWIISRAYYIIYKRAYASEKIMLNTWSRGNDGLFAFRDYSMEGEEGEVLMTGTSYWPLIDFTSHKPIRLNDTLATYEYDSRNATERAKLDRLKMPDMTDADSRMEISARYSMIDHVGHVNNSEYVKLIFDSLMQTDFDLDKPFSLEINYNHETQPDDTLSVLRKQDNDAHWFLISNSRGLSVTARVSRANN